MTESFEISYAFAYIFEILTEGQFTFCSPWLMGAHFKTNASMP